ncbi:MAG: right-handed parallel beta-helix repeat-containing protein [Thermoplasmata archaeon]|nr:right-handed parallel beta-helix repeat-containing protein [Thermoplasmata archaeon]
MKKYVIGGMVLVGIVAILAIAGNAKGATINVPADYPTIQQAVDAASDGDTIIVAAGTYTESVTITKSITLTGQPGAKIVCPSSPDDAYIQESSKKYEYVIGIFGGTYESSNDTYYSSGTVSVTISGFTIDSNNYVPSQRYVAIFFRNMVGSISDCNIINTYVDSKETFGILGYGDDNNVNINDNTVDQFARGGIGVNGGMFTISDNTVIGPGLGVPATWAPNGIQVGYGATGTVRDNEVSGCGWPGTDWVGTGILVVDTHGVTVDGNYVHDCEQAIGVVDFPAAFGGPWLDYLSDVTVSNNIIDDNEWGITINNDARNIRVIGNTITNNDYDAIDVFNYRIWYPSYSIPSPTDIEVHGNEIYNNGWGLWTDSYQTDTVDAENNWWGDPTGPYNATSNPSGLGDGVEGNVDFNPWYGNAGGESSVDYSTSEDISGTETVNVPELDAVVEITSSSNTLYLLGYTDNPADPLPSGALNVGDFLDIYVADENNVDYPIYLQINYTAADLAAAGLTEDELLGIAYWDDDVESWVLLPNTGVDTTNFGIYEGYAWAYLEEGQLSPKVIIGGTYTYPYTWLTVTLDPDGYVGKASTFTIHCEGSTAWKIHYKIDDDSYEGNWNQEVHFQIGSREPGEHTIEYWAEDASGYEEKHHVEVYYLDVEGPAVDISFEGIYQLSQGGTYQITPLTAILLSAVDDGCGVDRIEYSYDGGEWITYNGGFFLPEGNHELAVRAYDLLGNVEGRIYSIEVGGAPVTVCHFSPEKPDGNDGWYISEVKVTLESYDSVGVDKTFYRIDGGEWTEYKGTFSLGDGEHVIEFYSVNKMGIQEEVRSSHAKVDLYAPEINIEKPKSWLYIANRAILPLMGDRAIIIGGITISATIQDTHTSGVRAARLYVDDVIKQEGTTIDYFLDESTFGQHTIRIEAEDVAGNRATMEIRAFIINL